MLLLLSVLAALAGMSVAAAVKRQYENLRFSDDGTFDLAIFSDLHFGENAWDQWGPQQDIETVELIDRLMDYRSPDLVVFNGDLITGNNAYRHNNTATVDKMVKPLLDRDLPWASTYGNHDTAPNLSRQDILRKEQRWPNALTRQMVTGPNAGVSNYYLLVLPSRDKCAGAACDVPELILWFFDSRGGTTLNPDGKEVPEEDWVDASVVEWFEQQSMVFQQRYQKSVPSLAFVHIPTYAALAFQNKIEIDPHREPGVNDDHPLSAQGQGWCPDGQPGGNCLQGQLDLPFMQALVNTPGLMAVFSGHDHGDTWCFRWDSRVQGVPVPSEEKDLHVCFGQHSGYGGYGRWARGARYVTVSQADEGGVSQLPQVETWIRTDLNMTVGSVSLNSTFGDDVYPQTPNDMSSCQGCNYTTISPMPETGSRRRRSAVTAHRRHGNYPR